MFRCFDCSALQTFHQRAFEIERKQNRSGTVFVGSDELIELVLLSKSVTAFLLYSNYLIM